MQLANTLTVAINVKYDPATEICVTVGATGALNEVFRSILNPGDKILVILLFGTLLPID
jgi:aminotransferase